jgi:NAD(P)-dependent dehydrogenase (short-subunit alcohol dehydrogenase family)
MRPDTCGTVGVKDEGASNVNEKKQVVAVAGASAGVGRAIAVAFARDGADVGLIARGAKGLEATLGDIESAGGVAHAVTADVADPEAVESAAAEIEEHLGPIDVWVNNAMVTVYGPAWELTPEEFARVTDVTYHGSVWGTLAALRRMRPRGRGTIVQVGSALAYRGIPVQAAYCGAKHALVGFVDSVRSELLRDGVDVHITHVHLPAVNTPQFTWARTKLDRQPQPVPPIFAPEVAARAVIDAVARRRREVLVAAPTVKTVLADRIAPSLMDRYLADAAVEGQMTDEPVESNRADNLFEPVDEDRGASGPFVDSARQRSIVATLGRQKVGIGAGIAAIAAAGAWMLRRSR